MNKVPLKDQLLARKTFLEFEKFSEIIQKLNIWSQDEELQDPKILFQKRNDTQGQLSRSEFLEYYLEVIPVFQHQLNLAKKCLSKTRKALEQELIKESTETFEKMN